MAAKKEAGSDGTMEARREEVRMRKQEAAQERRRIANMKREQKVKDAEVKRKIREQKGGMGVTLVFYDKSMPKKKKSCEVAMPKGRRGKR